MTLLASCESPLAPDVTEVEHLEVTPPVLTMSEGGEATLIARVYGPDDALLPAANVFWSTQDRAVVTVNQNGLVTAVAAGTAQIAASSGGQSRTIAVTVSPRPIALVRITPPAGNVAVGQTLTLQGEALDGTGAIIPNRSLEWTSTAPTIATVSNAGVVTGVTIGQTTISATGEGKVGTSIVSVFPTLVTSITIQPDGGIIPAGATLALTATPRDAGGQPLAGRQVSWRSSNDAIATVSSAGLVTAISPGTVTVTASATGAGPNGSTPSATVNVTVLVAPVASAVVVPSSTAVLVGRTVTLTLNLFGAGGAPLSIAGRTVTWSTSNAAVATVNSSGVVTGLAVGAATVTVTVTTPGQPGTVMGTAQVNVSSQPVASVVVTPSSGTVHVGYNRTFVGVARDSNGQPLPGRVILWTSSNQAVATVDAATGVVTGVSQGTVQIRATSEGVQGEASVVIDLVPVSSVLVTPPTATLTVPQTIQLAAQPRDSAGNAIQGPALGGRTTTWASATPSAATVSASGVVTAVAQGASIVTATIGGIPGQSSITVSPLPSATQLAMVTEPSPTAQNDLAFPQQPAVQLKDALGNNVPTAGVTIQAAIASGNGTLGGTLTAVTNPSGTATFTNLRITGTIGTRTLTFSSGVLTPATSSGVNVTHGVATQLFLVAPPPATANSGQAFSSASVVQLQDISGNNVTQSGVLVTASVPPGTGATLNGGSTTTTASGTATFGALTLTGPAGPYTLTFSSPALTSANSGTITLSAGSGSKLAILLQPSATAQNGAAFGTQPQVQLQDGSGNPVTDANVSISAAIQTGGGTLGGTTVAMTNASGIATFSNLSISGTIGNRTLAFFTPGYTTVVSGVIQITAGPPAALFIATPPSSTAQSGAVLASQPAIQVRDASGNPVPQPGIVITATLVGPGGSLLPGSNTATTDGTGLATFSGLGISGTAGNSFSLTFSSGSLPSIGSGSITLSADAASQLTITTQPDGAASGSAFSTQPVIQVRDAQGNPVLTAGTTVTASIASGPPGATLSGGNATTNGSGQAVFSGLGLSGTVGSYTIAFTSGSLTGATSDPINLTHGAAAQLVVMTQPSGAASGAVFGTQPVILVRDAQNNPVPSITVSATPSAGATLVGSGTSLPSDAAGLAAFNGLGLSGLVGTYTLTFSAGAAPNVTSGSVSLAAGAAAKLSMSAQPPASTANGSAFGSSVQLSDNAGNAVSQAGVNVTVGLVGAGAALSGTTTVATDGAGVAAFSGLTITGTFGNYQLSFSSGGLSAATSNTIALTAGAATQLTIATPPPGTAVSGTPFASAPSVQLRDQSGNAVSQAGVTVDATLTGSGGTLIGSASANTDANGLATFSGLGISASAAGNFTISFSSGSLTGTSSGTIAVTMPATQLFVATQPSGTASSGTAFSVQPSVQILDAVGIPVNQAGILVTAAVTGGGASIVGASTATTNGSGVATFTGLGIAGTIGSYTVTFSASGLTSVVSASILLGAGAATQLVIVQQPGNGTTGVPLSPQPTIQVRDAQGNNVATAGVTVTAAIQIGPGNTTLQGGSATTDASGLASFTGLALTHSGTNIYTLRFSATGLTGATSAQITISP